MSDPLPTPQDETAELASEPVRATDSTAELPAAIAGGAVPNPELVEDDFELGAGPGSGPGSSPEFDETVQLDSAEAAGLPARPRGDQPVPAGTHAPGEFSSERYRVVRELGRGGMGVVLEAFDKRLERRVALKVLLSGDLAGSDARERFQLEARAAARLKHPNLVAVHEVGEEGGRPFLVMDYVEGESLAAWLRRDGPLPSHRAAEIAYCLAEALYTAHVCGILHRDVKPANVLIAKDGKTLLTDFGLAKEIESGREGITQSGYVVGTPAYMSPEQALGQRDRLDRRSDVYGIGATLYEMLVGKPPFVAPTLPVVLSMVVHDEPAPLRPQTPGIDRDLETICLKCLEKEPADRYGSAKDLAADLARYLANDSILARPPAVFERGRKWLKRNSLVARTLTLSLGLSIMAGIGGTVWFMRQLDRERRTAQAAAREAALALDLLVVDVQQELGDLPGARVRRARQRLLSKALDRLLALRTSHLQTLRSAEVGRQLAQLALQAGEGSRARQLAEDAVERSRIGGEGEVGDMNTALSLLVLGDVERVQGESGAATAHYREAIELLSSIKTVEGATQEASVHLVEALIRESGHLFGLGEFEASEVSARRAQELARGLPRSESLLLRSAAADACGRVLEARVNTEGALASYREGIELARDAVRADPKSVEARRFLMASWSHLGRVRRTRGDLEGSVKADLEGLRLAGELLRADPESLRFQQASVALQVDLADTYEALGRADDALPLLRAALTRNRDLVASDPEGIDSRILCAALAERLVAILTARGEYQEARLLLGEQIRLAEEVLARSPQHREAQRALGGALEALAALHIKRGELAKGEQRLREVIALRRELVQVRPDRDAQLELSSALIARAEAWQNKGKLDEAREALKEALAIRRKLVEANPTDIEARQALARAYCELIDVERSAEQFKAAEAALKLGLEAAAPLHQQAPSHAKSRQVLATLAVYQGAVALEQGHPDQARPALTEAVRLRRALLVNNASDIVSQRALGRALSRLADLELAEGRRAPARDLYEEVLATQRARLQQHPEDTELRRDLLVGLVKLSDLDLKVGKLEAAASRLKEADGVGRVLLEKTPGMGAAQYDRLIVAARLAKVSMSLGRKSEALKAYKDAAQLSGLVLDKSENGARRRNLSVFWLKISDLTRGFGDEFGARAYLERAVKNHIRAAKIDPRLAPQVRELQRKLKEQRRRCELLSGDVQPTSDSDRVFLAQVHLQNERPAEALGYYRQLLGSEEGRRKLGLLAEGIQAASLAVTKATDSVDRADFLDQGLKWLEFTVKLCRSELKRAPGMIKEAPEELKAGLETTRRQIVAHLAQLEQDPTLEPLRADPRYAELFPAKDPR
ncbi:MAG: protein kinase [Planctomycetes bacterium]|nr:protein kinase [Planctomycetota bacterium]